MKGVGPLSAQRITRALVAQLLFSLVVACGGGGDASTSTTGTGSGGTGSTGSQSGLNYTLSATSVQATVDTTNAAAQTAVVNYTINNYSSRPSNVGYHQKVAWTGTAIAGVNATLANISPPPASADTSTGTITIQFWSSTTLGAGTFTGTVTFSLCWDPSTLNCDSLLAGPPTTISVTLTVTGAARPTTTAVLSPTSLATHGATSDAAGPTPTLLVTLNQWTPGPFVTIDQPAGGFVTSASYTPVGPTGGTLSLGLMRPASLGLGTYSESLQVNFCIDAACTQPLQNSPRSLVLTYTVTASAGVDYTLKTVPAIANDIAWSDVRQRIYAALPARSALNPKSIVEVDPQTAVITRALTLAGEPTVIAVSDDGVYGYVGFSDLNIVQRVNLSTMSADAILDLGSDPTYGLFHAGYLAAQPGSPRSIAVSRYALAPGLLSDWASEQVLLFDDAIARPAAFGATDHGQKVNSLAWNASGTTLYAWEAYGLDLFTVGASASGLAQSNVVHNVVGASEIRSGGAFVYTSSGSAIDPATGVHAADFFPPGSHTQGLLALDTSRNRCYYFFGDDLGSETLVTIASFDTVQRSVVMKAYVSGMTLGVGGITGTRGRLIRWGPSGLALATQEGIQIFDGALVTR